MAARLMWITWPAFLAACLLEALVFALVDPAELAWSGHSLGWSRQSTYTVAFFAFWGVNSAACWLTTLLRMSPQEVNEADRKPMA